MRPEPPPDARPAPGLRASGAGADVPDPPRRSMTSPPGLSAQEFLDVADSLHRELEGERTRRRLHAVIEQAKGILVAQYGISLEEAFQRLRVMSQEHNVRLVEVAATLVGANLPPGERLDVDLSFELPEATVSESSTWSRYRADPDVRAGTASAILDSRARSADVAATSELLRAVCAPLGNDAAALYRLTQEQRMLLVTSFGLPRSVVSAWQTIPPGVDVPVVRAAMTGTMIPLRDRRERTRLFPRLLTVQVTSEAALAIPVRTGDAITGALVLLWDAAKDFDPDFLARAEHITAVAGSVLLQAGVNPHPEQRMLEAILDILFDPWLLADPIEDDLTPGFRIRSASRDIPGAEDLPGRRVLELWPDLAVNDVFTHLLTVHRTDQPWVTRLTADQVDGLPNATPGTELRVIRLGPSLFLHTGADTGVLELL